MGALIGQLADDGRALIQQEISLAGAEIRASVRSLAKGSIAIALGVSILLIGLLVLLGFLVIGLGVLLGGEYWLSCLLVGGALALIGGITMLGGKRALARGSLEPHTTLASLQESKAWAQAEVRDIRRGFDT